MLAYYVGLAFLKSKIIGGLMAEINLDFKTMKNMCPLDIDVACCNSPHNYIVSGPTSSVRAFLAKLQVWKHLKSTNNISMLLITFN